MSKQNILIVEDEQTLSGAYKTVLKKEGYNAEIAKDGEQALKTLKDFEPDLILLDLRMPNMNGIEFLKKYRPDKKHPSVKIIVFSNLDTQNEIDEAYGLGAHKYMLKAWASPRELVRFVKETLEEK
jgi:DNA-binding response OmpR family regulator